MKETLITNNPLDHQKVFANYYHHEQAQGLIVLFHGMAEHKERYENFALFLHKHHFSVLVCDHRGHGESLIDGKIKGHFGNQDGWFYNLEDLHQLTNQALKKNNINHHVLIAHSMGSLVAQSYFKRYAHHISHLILTGIPESPPMLSGLSLFAKALAKRSKTKESDLLYQSSFLKFDKKTKSKEHLSWLSLNQDNVKAYKNDPLCGFKFTNQGLVDLLEGFKDIKSFNLSSEINPKTSIWFIIGEEDVTVNMNQVQKRMQFYQELGYEHVTTTLIAHAAHEVLFEKNMEYLYKQIVDHISKKEEKSE